MVADVAGEPSGGGAASRVPREARPYQGLRAGLVTRLVAAIVDVAVVGLTLLAGYFVLAGLLFLVDSRNFELPRSGLLLSFTMACAVTLAYLTVTWTLSGRTYGYLVMGLRVLGRGGRPLGLVGAALRAVLVVLFPIGILWVGFSRENRSAQDLVLGTAVVYDWQPRGVLSGRPPT